MQAPATNLAPKPIKVLSMRGYVPSTEPVNHAESGRRRAFVSSRSLAGSGKYRLGNPPDQRLSVRMPKVDKAPRIVRVKATAAATSAAIKVPPSTPPILPVHQLPQLLYLPSRLKRNAYRCPGLFDSSICSITFASFASIARSRGYAVYPRILFIYVYLSESVSKIQTLARNLHAVLRNDGVLIFPFSVLEAQQPRNMLVHLTFPQMVSSRLHIITRPHTTKE